MITQFTNWTDEDFEYPFNKVPHRFPARSVVMIDEGQARHFAKHLADRELNKRGVPTDEPNMKVEFMANALGGNTEIAQQMFRDQTNDSNTVEQVTSDVFTPEVIKTLDEPEAAPVVEAVTAETTVEAVNAEAPKKSAKAKTDEPAFIE